MVWRQAIAGTGFAILPEVFSPESVDRVLKEISELEPRRSRAGVRHALGLAPVTALARQALLLDLARAVLGANAFPYRATLFDKAPAANWLVVWHQDTALPLRERLDLPGWGPWSVKEGIHYAHAPAAALSQVLALRVHLDDSTAGNGPLRILPRTHNLGVLSDDALHHLSTRIVPVDCVCPKGGVLAMRPLVVHASSKSQTQMPRRVLHIEYAASASLAEPLELAVA
ncbi:MAG TPA: phytanoyl-CoA dioxygenase family protein [Candidatus Sulfotelmatobacter sp.]|nr:phytanoyl-CoA dioxygenase family protein [Candidatus Sulfotelmatobacter sp.]